MENKLKNTQNRNKTIVMLSTLSVVSSVLTAFFGELIVPFAIASFAAFYLYDASAKRFNSIIVSLIAIALTCVASVFADNYAFLLAIEAVLIGAIIAICYSRRMTKAATALFSTVAATVIIVLSLIAVPMIAEKSFSFDTVSLFYETLYGTVKEQFVASFNSLLSSISTESMNIDMSAFDVAAIFDTAMYLMISLVVVSGFAISGIAIKIFCAFVKRLDADVSFVSSWKFVTPSLYAHFYLIIALLNVFIGVSGDAFGLTVANLYQIFTFVYAYVGFKLIYDYFGEHHSKIIVAALLLVILLCLSTTAFQIFSLIGVFYTLYRNKVDSGDFGGFNFNK